MEIRLGIVTHILLTGDIQPLPFPVRQFPLLSHEIVEFSSSACCKDSTGTERTKGQQPGDRRALGYHKHHGPFIGLGTPASICCSLPEYMPICSLMLVTSVGKLEGLL